MRVLDCGWYCRPASDRRAAAATELTALGCDVTEIDLDARDHESHTTTIEQAFADGDIDIAVIAFGLLGDPERAWRDPDLALELAEVNYTAPVHLGVLLGQRMQTRRTVGSWRCRALLVSGYGAPTSSTARPRRAWTGSSSAWVKRCATMACVCSWYGQVSSKSKMTAGLDEVPLAVTPDQVADASSTPSRPNASSSACQVLCAS